MTDKWLIDWCLKPTLEVFQTIEWWIQINQRTLINDGQMTDQVIYTGTGKSRNCQGNGIKKLYMSKNYVKSYF